MKITIINNSKYIKHVGDITLNIGANEGIDKAEWDKALKLPIVQGWVKNKDVEVKEGSIDSVTDLTAEKAIALIETTFSQDKLQKWLEEEKRKTVIEAIKQQLKEIATPKSGE